MNRILLSFITLVNSLFLQAQSESDNLRAALQRASTDSSKVSIYLALYDVLAETDTAASAAYLKQAITLSDQNPGQSFSCLTYLKLSKYFRKQGKLPAAAAALKRVGDACKHVKAIEAAIYSERGILNQLAGRYDSAVNYFLHALAIDESINNYEKCEQP